MKRVEEAIQRALVSHIEKTYADMVLQATLNENSRNKIEMGLSVGITDLIIFIRRGDVLYVFFHELKTKAKTSKLRTTQIDWHDQIYVPKLQASNTNYAVSKGLSAAIRVVNEWFISVRNN